MSDKFIIKHYADDPHPTLKGNGFDGLVIGDYREEAEGFITYINNRIEQLQEQVAELAKDRAFFRSCALSGEIPECGSEPSALEQKP